MDRLRASTAAVIRDRPLINAHSPVSQARLQSAGRCRDTPLTLARSMTIDRDTDRPAPKGELTPMAS